MQNTTANSVLLVKMMKTHELEKWHQVIVYPHRNGASGAQWVADAASVRLLNQSNLPI